MAKRLVISSESSSASDDEVPCPRYSMEPMPSLPFLPDDCLLAIMKYLGPVDLNNLSRVCERISLLAEDKRLWKKIDFRPYRLSATQLMRYLKFFNPATRYLAIQGFIGGSGIHWRRTVVTPHLLDSIRMKCPFLETLILERVKFKLSLTNFPTTLTYLSLKRSVVTGLDSRTSYFQGMHNVFPNLKVLILSNCVWVASHDFMAISKCQKLEELRMNSCPQLGDCVAYTSLAARFGFASLKILDLRNTKMGDSDVIAFRHTRTLTHLYLEFPLSDSEDSDSRCEEKLCHDDLSDSPEDDEEMELSPVISPRFATSRLFLPPSVRPANSSPFSSPISSQESQNCKKDHVSPRLMNDGQNGVGNGDLARPQSSSSSKFLNLKKSPPFGGPSHVRIGRKHIRPRKRSYADSQYSDDIYTSQLNTSDAEIFGSSSGSSSPDKKVRKLDDINAKQNPRLCSDEDGILSKNIKIVPVPADPYANVVAGPSSSMQDLPEPNSIVVISATAQPSSEGNSENDSEIQLDYDTSLPFYMPPDIEFNIFNPNFYYQSDNEDPFNDATITDMCIMSFVLDDTEADQVGYIRLVSPESSNARSQLHTLVLRNYRLITDETLQYLYSLHSLRYLDVSGTAVTEGGVLEFKLKRPEVQVISDFKNLPV